MSDPTDFETDGAARGPFTVQAEGIISSIVGGGHPMLTTSCTAALEMAALLIDIQPGDEVAVPSFGFVTTALAFVRAGARIKFIDIDDQTLAMDPDHLADSMTPSVRAVVPIHYGGLPARVSELADIASTTGATLIEDTAHGFGGSLHGTPLGSFGAMSALSFHATKNFSCGEGGALVVNDSQLIGRARVVLEKGTDRQMFLDGHIDKYTWRDVGSSFGLSDFLAQRLIQQLNLTDQIQARRRAITAMYDEALGPAAERLGFRTPFVPNGCVPAYHLYYVILEDSSVRDQTLQRLQSKGIHASFHYIPLHNSPGGRKWGAPAVCPVSEDIAESIIRLPLHQAMSVEDAERSIDVFLDAMEEIR